MVLLYRGSVNRSVFAKATLATGSQILLLASLRRANINCSNRQMYNVCEQPILYQHLTNQISSYRIKFWVEEPSLSKNKGTEREERKCLVTATGLPEAFLSLPRPRQA